jgi:hypothetical protein
VMELITKSLINSKDMFWLVWELGHFDFFPACAIKVYTHLQMDLKLTLKNMKNRISEFKLFYFRVGFEFICKCVYMSRHSRNKKRVWTCNVNTLIHVHMYIHMFLTIRISQGIVYFSAT